MQISINKHNQTVLTSPKAKVKKQEANALYQPH